MREPRWERDTLFLVFEEDYRFTEDNLRPAVMKASGLQEVVGDTPTDTEDEPRVPLDWSNTAAPPMSFLSFFLQSS